MPRTTSHPAQCGLPVGRGGLPAQPAEKPSGEPYPSTTYPWAGRGVGAGIVEGFSEQRHELLEQRVVSGTEPLHADGRRR